ncbi:hypothetical protein RGQ13_08055 [Thalassotalea psychrophila]|uniref:Lipoprotein n=1 Tax=Thalassotalea psychrophila TaxID=3065647 RepID=A0ABY9TZD5_9GAMM|nr:hypothetical protein RGQ13_08055 [Colwelliaceae bacterium SQ149]
MNKLIMFCLFSAFLTGCASSESSSSSSSSAKANSAPTDECATLEYLARQQCLTEKMNAG